MVGDIVYYEADESFYTCILTSTGNLPTDDTYFESNTDASLYDYVLDSDITKAFGECQLSFNQRLLSGDTNVEIGYMYLTAHYLVYDIRTSKFGVNSIGDWGAEKRKVGNVLEEYYIPKNWVSSPILNFYTKTGYGLKYLNLVMPKITGNVQVLAGTTLPSWQTYNATGTVM